MAWAVQRIHELRCLLEQCGATRKGGILGKLLKALVGPNGLEPLTSTVSKSDNSDDTQQYAKG